MYTGIFKHYAAGTLAAAALTMSSSAFADGHNDAAVYESDEMFYVAPETAAPIVSSRPQLRSKFNALPEWIENAKYIVINPATNRVLFEKGADDIEEPASLTKLLTAGVIFEAIAQSPDKFNLDDEITVPQWAIDTIKNHPLGIAHFRNIEADTPYQIGDLLLGMGARSDGISTLALVMHFADNYFEWEGTEFEKNNLFVEEMNKLAQKIGMSNSEFNVTTGIRSSGTNESTAEDFAHLVDYMNEQHPELMEHTFGTPKFSISDLTNWTVPTSRLFQRRPERVQNAKTGATNNGYTFTLTYERSGSETPLIAVIMNVHAPNDHQARERRSQLALDILTAGYDVLDFEGPDAGRIIDEDIITDVLESERPLARPWNPLRFKRPLERPINLVSKSAANNTPHIDLAH